jgi:hypothetical protein
LTIKRKELRKEVTKEVRKVKKTRNKRKIGKVKKAKEVRFCYAEEAFALIFTALRQKAKKRGTEGRI